MQDIVSPLQSISYTNKDFQKIYPELLDLVKELTNKWDPSISNESDPGVILIKLNALIADKCNYNIDKNVLECFPLSVTQVKNARQLFEQLGYYMKWYNSATTYVSLKWSGEDLGDTTFPIPPFTMITDEEKTVVYTITGTTPVIASQEFNIGTVNLPGNGKTVNVKAIQGIAVKYDINGETVITPQMLDSDNRIYFNFSNIAENGIFITNTGSISNYDSWERKDNLLVEELGNTFYKFGVSSDGSTCYLEFPEDYDMIMKDGIEITYIRSDGSYGNVSAQQLNNFYSDLAVTSSRGESIVLNSQNVSIINYFASSNGKDYESINEAYKNYKRVVGTFETLITLRDYINYIVSHNLASNGFVCDRSNDIQNCYGIMQYQNGINSLTNVIDEIGGQPSMTAFSLKMYLTKYYQDISNVSNYNNSFQLMNDSELTNVEDYIKDVKAIQHDYEDILSTTDSRSHFCLFKNKYPLNCTIIPQYTLSVSQQNEVKNNIKLVLYRYLNSSEIEFGDYIKSDYLYKIISESDVRIKSVILDSIQYDTYAVYFDSNSGQYKEVLISGEDSCTVSLVDSNDDEISSYSVDVDVNTFINQLIDTDSYFESGGSYPELEFIYDTDHWELDSVTVSLSDYGITLSSGASPSSGDKINIQLSKSTQIRDEVLAKSVLAGITPFFIQNEQFDYLLDQQKNPNYNSFYNDIKKISPEVTINLSQSANEYTLRSNEVIQLFAPNLLQKSLYNNYVKFECQFLDANDDPVIIPANTYYELTANDIIILYWKSSASSGKYSYVAYGEGSIICPSFSLSSSDTTTSIVSEMMQRFLTIQSTPKIITNTDYELSESEEAEVVSINDADSILSSGREIGYYEVNSVEITPNMNCYWSLNYTNVINNDEYYVLFDIGDTERVLQSGEYFFYTNNEMTEFVALGGGTRITRSTDSDSMKVRVVELSDITLNGISALQSYWYTPQYNLSVEEEQFITLQEGYKIKLTPKAGESWPAGGVDIESTSTVDLSNFDIKYTTNQIGAEEVSVPEFNFVQAENWCARSMLNINTSSSIEQILLSGQHIKLLRTNDTQIDISGSDLIPANPPSNPFTYYPVVFKTSQPIQATGLNSIDTVFYSSDLTPEYLTVYIYIKQLTRPNIVTYVGNNCSVLIQLGQSSSSAIRFTLPAGDYLLPVTVPSLSGGQAYISVEDITAGTSPVQLTPIYSNSPTLYGQTLYPMKLSTEGHTYDLVITLSSAATRNIAFLFTNPLKYESTNKFKRIIQLIKKFDKDNIFNYTFINNPDLIIEDPLKSDSFLNSNHIYNKNTICQLDTDSLSNIKVQ